MLRLRDIMTDDVVTVSPELSIRDAMELFVARHVSGAPVVAGGVVQGVVSVTDLLAAAIGPPGNVRAGTAEPDDDTLEALLSGFPDLGADEGTAAYFTDVGVDAIGEDGVRATLGANGGPGWLDVRTVSEVMTSVPVATLPPTAPVREAAEFMRRQGIHRVLVIEGSRLLGIVTTMDIARAVADGRLATHTYVFSPERHFDQRGWRDRPPAPDLGAES